MFLRKKKTGMAPKEENYPDMPPLDNHALTATLSMPPPGKESPPLFVKVDKYNDILQSISDLKSYSAEIRQSIDMLSEVEQKLAKSLAASYRSLDALNTIISILMARLVSQNRPEAKGMAQADIGHYFKDIHKEVERIKSELQTV